MLHTLEPKRLDGFLSFEHYAAIGDGRSAALVGADGAIDWWCAPDIGSPSLFNRLHDPRGGHFTLRPSAPFSIERHYRKHSNVLETVFINETGRARVTESLNSGVSRRLPWCELARRIEGTSGTVDFEIVMAPICAHGPVQSARHTNARVRYIGDLTTTFCHGEDVLVVAETETHTVARYTARQGSRTCIALLVADEATLAIPVLSDIDARIDLSDAERRRWAGTLTYDGPFMEDLSRCALSLKFLLHSETGAIAPAATAGLPERIGGQKNYDYTMHPETDRLDAVLLTTRFGFEHDERLRRTRAAIERELAVGPLVYRYSGAAEEEGAFVACSCWLVEAYAFLGEVDLARLKLEELLVPISNNFGILNEQIDPATGGAREFPSRAQPSRTSSRHHFYPGKSPMKADLLSADLPLSQLSEGACWNASSSTLYWVDIKGRKVHAFAAATHKHTGRNVSKEVSFVFPKDDRHLLLDLSDGIYDFDPATGQETAIARLELPSHHRLNDGKLDPAGRLWFGTINTADQPAETAALYVLRGRQVEEVDNGFVNANGKAWSPDGRYSTMPIRIAERSGSTTMRWSPA